MKYAAFTVGLILSVSGATFAQSLADAAAEAAKIKHEWPVSMNLGPPPEPPLTAAELADMDRSKFDKTYEAAKAVDAAKFVVSPRQFQQLLLILDTELSIVFDKVKTKGEKSLAAKYMLAKLQFDLALAYRDRSGVAAVKQWGEALAKATSTLDAANDIYIGKPKAP